MIGAGTVINPIVRIVTVVAILASVYFFIIRPTLDSTENITSKAFDSGNDISRNIHNNVQRSLRQANRATQGAFDSTNHIQVPKASGGGTQSAAKLLRCIQNAAGDITRIQACNQ